MERAIVLNDGRASREIGEGCGEAKTSETTSHLTPSAPESPDITWSVLDAAE